MSDSADPLSRLVVDQAEVNRELVAELLADKVTIDTNDATFTFKRNVRKQLNGTRVVVTALLAQKALVLLGAETTEALQPRELEALTGIRGGTLRPILKKLSDDGIVSRKADGYVLPNAALEDIEDLLNE